MNVPRLLPGKLGRYNVGAKIGGGGMATIYLGRAEGGGLAALKVIKDELASAPTYMDMFFDEAKILSRLSHPNVIRTMEYGVDGDNRFIAMELLLGRSLMDVWDILAERSAHIPIALGAWICARVAEGLHAAHELRSDDGKLLEVIHRDVNPSNIFLTYDGVVKLIDFGLARARVRMSKSAEGIVKGKIPYLAPEQAQGQTIDRRIDVYALGTTLWELATMNRLFKRENDIATLQAIRDATVPDVRLINPAYPIELWQVIEKALQRDRDKRYSTSEDIQKDLDAYLAAHAPTTGPETLRAFLDGHFAADKMEQEAWASAASAIGPSRNAYTMPPPLVVPAVPPPVPKPGALPQVPGNRGRRERDGRRKSEFGEEAHQVDRRAPEPKTKSGRTKAAPRANRKERRRRGGRIRSSVPPPMPSRRDSAAPPSSHAIVVVPPRSRPPGAIQLDKLINVQIKKRLLPLAIVVCILAVVLAVALSKLSLAR